MTTPDSLVSALADRYRIERELGQGGMATVYLAEDLKHDRKVAVKVLKPELAAVVGGDRFISEIRTTANLQHPHILPLFDSGQAGGFLFYVMPYVVGESLRDRLDREKQLSVPEAVAITVKIAGALQTAHDQGVIHRDVKPANILLQNGEPVVADFGIALAVQQAGEGRITETGLSLGTPYYMAPEQATADRDPDQRSDLYSLGCMLYEMLTGEPPFHGTTAQAVLGRILTQPPPDVTQTRPSVPPHIAMALTRSLQKLPADRFDSVAEFSRALQNEGYVDPAIRASGAWAGVQSRGPAWKRALPWGIAALMAVLAMGSLLWPSPEAPPRVPVRAQLTGVGMAIMDGGGVRLTISPDGRFVVVAGQEPGDEVSRLFVRTVGALEWRPLPNTEGARGPTVSPDSRSVAFMAAGALFRVPIDGGPALPIAADGNSPHWGADGTIVYTGPDGLMRVAASGGDPELLLEEPPTGISRPHLLPDGSGVLFASRAAGDPLSAAVYHLDMESGEVREIAPSGNQPVYARTGHVIYGHGNQSLMAVPFDLQTGEVGAPTTVIPELSVFAGGASQFALAADAGTLVYNHRIWGEDERTAENSLIEVALDGTEVSSLNFVPGRLEAPRYSPDGRRIAYEDGDEIRIYDVASGASPQLTDGGGRYPVWSPGGDMLYFSIGGTGGVASRRKADSSEPTEELGGDGVGAYLRAVVAGSGGDSLLILRRNTSGTFGRDLLLARLGPEGSVPDGGLVAEPYLTAQWEEWQAEVSPDGRYVAYMSNQEGQPRVYVQDFPVPGGQRAVSPGEGADPRWAPDGRSLYYRSGTTFFQVDVSLEPTFSVGSPRELFDEPRYVSQTGNSVVPNYDIHPDGDRFILTVGPEGMDAQVGSAGNLGIGAVGELEDVYIVTDWYTELLELTGGGGR
jgi:serine/threonine-protein kinase